MQETRGRRLGFFVAALAAVGFGGASFAEVAPAPLESPAAPGFARDVATVLDRWCVRCHGPREQQASLRLDDYESTLRGGDSGPAIVAGAPDESLLVAKIERRDRPAMPPRKRLPKAAVAAIRAWIAAGALP